MLFDNETLPGRRIFTSPDAIKIDSGLTLKCLTVQRNQMHASSLPFISQRVNQLSCHIKN